MILLESLETQMNLTYHVPKTTVKCRAFLTSGQVNLTDGAWTKVLLNNESYDIGSNFDTANSRFTAPVTGYYSISGTIHFTNVISDVTNWGFYNVGLYVNGALYASAGDAVGVRGCAGTATTLAPVTAGQYVELYAWVLYNAASHTVDVTGGSAYTALTVYLENV